MTVANWEVREPAKKRKAKNVLFFIGDGTLPIPSSPFSFV